MNLKDSKKINSELILGIYNRNPEMEYIEVKMKLLISELYEENPDMEFEDLDELVKSYIKIRK